MITKAIKRSFATAGKLLTWGQTTFGWGRDLNQNFRVPGHVEGFNNVTKVATGPYHLIFSTANNEVYSVGLGSNGRLGNNSNNTLEKPQSIDHLFQTQIKQLAAGCRHSLALTKQGTVYAWGFGGRTGGLFKYLPLLQSCSPLGLGQTGDVYTPTVVQKLNEKINHIAAGADLSLAVGQSGKVYGWGDGIRYLHEEPSSQPRQLQQINYFLHTHHAHVKKVKSAGRNAFFLLDDGKLYVVGRNNDGVFATRYNPKIRYDNTIDTLTQIVNEDLHGEKIVNFKVSSNSLIFVTDSGAVYYSGMGTTFRPQRFPVKAGTAKSIFATYDSVGVIDNQGRIGFLNDQFIENSVKKGEVYVSQETNLKNAIKIGGSHRLRYAIVPN